MSSHCMDQPLFLLTASPNLSQHLLLSPSLSSSCINFQLLGYVSLYCTFSSSCLLHSPHLTDSPPQLPELGLITTDQEAILDQIKSHVPLTQDSQQ